MSNNESKRPFADQVLEYAGVQVGDIWRDTLHAEDIKVLYIRDTDNPYPILVTCEDHVNTFINESYFSEKCTLVERGGQVVIGESNLKELFNVLYEVIYEHEGFSMVYFHTTEPYENPYMLLESHRLKQAEL